MPSRVLTFGRSQPSPTTSTASLEKDLKPTKIANAESKRLSSAMDLFHHKEKRQSWAGRPSSGGKSSPKMAPTKAATLNIGMESPPLVFYGTPAQSTGALLSGLLILNVIEHEVRLQTLEMELQVRVTTKKPVSKDCPSCTTKVSDLFKWNFLTEATVYKKGTHSFPFSYLLPGNLPATTHGQLGVVDYFLFTKATTSLSDTITFERALKLQRALMPGSDRTSIRVFPPTNLTANVVLPPVIHPIGAFPVQLRMVGVVEKDAGKDHQRRWRIRKMNWRIEEHSKIISPACPKHAHKVGGEGKGILHQDTRTIGEEDLKDGWKTDFDVHGGEIDMEFNASINSGLYPLCDVDSPTGLTVTHNLVVELIVAEEYCPNKNTRLATPTGAARVLRMSFTLVVTERSGLGISWDEEQPPIYDDVPASPPGYARMEDYTGEPLLYEDLNRMGH
ncbi:hypothetical protein MMC24_006259 [Lignoscripta atroalba]|nr:hypothetical protein [Lignoscripta atroalba]